MKKITLTIAGALLAFGSFAQTQRTILYEEFTGENCGPCAATNPGLTTFIHQNGYFPSKVLLVRYQCNIPSAPGAGSLYVDSKTDESVRQTYYSVPFAPYARFDGGVLKEPASQGTGSDGHAYWIEDTQDYPNIVQDSATNNAPFALTVNHVFNATYDSVVITATVTAAQAYNATSAGALVLQLAMQEAEVHFATAPGTNGEKDFYDVMRKMVPSSSGTTLNNTWANGATQTLTIRAKIPTYIKDKSQLAFVGFIQDNGTKRVHQAAYSVPKPVGIDAATSNIINNSVLCALVVPVSTTIKNNGSSTLTSCVINYKLDAGSTSTYTWTGSLAAGTSTVVTLQSFTATATGTHTITINTSLPNNVTDQNTANDKKTTTFVIEGTPATTAVSEGFTAATFPPANWVKYDPQSGTTTWKRSTTAGGYGTSTNSATYPFYSNSVDGAVGSLFLPIENLSSFTSPQLKFDYAYDYYDTLGTTIYDTLEVLGSTDCGATWTSLWKEGGPGLATAANPGLNNANGFTPSATEWASKTISLTPYASASSYLVKFNAINHYGNNLYIDNVNLTSIAGIAKNNGTINAVRVYPNPASEQFNLKINVAASQKATIMVYNAIGQSVFTKTTDLATGENLVNISSEQFASGIYTIVVSSASGSYQAKVSISK